MLTLTDLFPPNAAPEPGSVHEDYVVERLRQAGRWGTEPLSAHVRRHAAERPGHVAYVGGEDRLTWAEFDSVADELARGLVASGVARGDRVAVIFPDGPLVHALYVGIERAGAIIVGIGPRAGELEVEHLLGVSGAAMLVSPVRIHRTETAELVATLRGRALRLRHLVVESVGGVRMSLDGRPVDTSEVVVEPERARRVDELFMLNSTSGTTGMPKCVTHSQDRWFYYHRQVLAAAGLTGDDVLLSLIPAPFGFALWTAHVTPILLGCTTVVMPRFDAAQAVRLIEREHATTLNCVSTQFIMMLNTGAFETTDVTSLERMFTGGEAIPDDRATEFEEAAGAVVLNFYGSNETGTLSYTTAADDRAARLTTSGRIVEEMQVRLFDEDRRDVTARGGPGQAACRGPATSWGYYADADANAKLFTADGWMLTGDICVIDDSGYLRVVGRMSDFIIRGGKNISAAAVEEQVGTHPAVAQVAAVAVPDDVFGERVCAVIVLRDGHTLEMADVQAHLAGRGVSKEQWPERLHFLDELPRASGGKVAKDTLRKLLADETV